jgi:protein phosphatase
MNSHEADTDEFVLTKPSGVADRPLPFSSLVRVDVWGLSHEGKARSNNEDHFLIVRFGRFLENVQTNLASGKVPLWSEEIGYGLLVADGLGGHAAGEIASELAITALVNLLLTTPDWILRFNDQALVESVLRRATERCQQINQVLTVQAEADPNLRGFGTTMTVAASVGKDLFVVHIGDSRVYLLRGDKMHQLTRDHTFVQTLANMGVVSQDAATAHRFRHVLTKVLGAGGHDEPDVSKLQLQDGDCLLLCSDGLTDMVDDAAIAETLKGGDSAEKTSQSLLHQALEAGGKDNISVIVARYGFPPA